jgi:PKD repeat protein
VVTVTPLPNPILTYDQVVGCQNVGLPIDNFMPPDGACIRFCANSNVNFTAQSQPGIIGSSFAWQILGGTLSNNVGLNTIATWGTPGNGWIRITETNNGCITVKTYCIEIINSPIAAIEPNLLLNTNNCFNVCLGQTVNFEDASDNNGGSDINTWAWDFGDGTYYIGNTGSRNPPAHLYSLAGQYDVTLTVTNECNCSNRRRICITVENNPGANITCTRSVCDGGTDVYCTDAKCNTYQWSVIGGSIMVDGINMGNTYNGNPSTIQPDNCDRCIEIQWGNNANPIIPVDDGFGYLSLNSANCDNTCASITTVKVPLIGNVQVWDDQHLGFLKGVCAGETYTFGLPQWPATNFNWSVTGDFTILSNNINSNTVTFKVNDIVTPGVSSFVICDVVNTLKGCSKLLAKQIYITPKPLLTAPSGNLSCLGNGTTLLLSNITTTPAGPATITISGANGPLSFTQPLTFLGSNQYSINLPAAATPIAGVYQIFVTHPNFCNSNSISLTILAPPAPPTFITGPELVCNAFTYNYTAGPLAMGTVLNWSVIPIGSANLAATGTNNNITWTIPGANSTINVVASLAALPACQSLPITKIVTKQVPFSTITANPNTISICENSVVNYSISIVQNSTTNIIVPEVIEWSIADPLKGSIVSGQGTNTISIAWNQQTAANTTIVNCKVTICGVVYNYTKSVSLINQTNINTITNTPIIPCSGVPVTFTAITSGAAPLSYSWNFGDGTGISTSASPGHTYTNLSNNNLTFNGMLTITSVCNAISTKAFTIVVKPQPNANLTPVTIVQVCAGANISQPAAISNTSFGTFSYQWFNNGVIIPGAVNSTFTINAGGIFTGKITNNTTLCSTMVGSIGVTTITCGSIQGSPCNPLLPSGITSITASVVGCGQVSATSAVLGTSGSNIISYGWSTDAVAGSYTLSGIGSLTQSPVFTFNKPGMYAIELTINYVDANNNNLTCAISDKVFAIVPLAAEAVYGIVCNGANNGYNITLQDNSPVYPLVPITSWDWVLNGSTINSSATGTVSIATNSTNLLQLTVSNGTGLGNTCTSPIYNITVPSLPIASYTASTNHPTNQAASCENQAILLTNTSTSANNIIFNEWDFGQNPVCKSNIPSYLPFTASNPQVGKEYNISTPFVNYDITLNIKDNFGCESNFTNTYTVFENNILATNNLYNLPNQLLCIGNTANNISKSFLSGGTAPIQYQWYNLATAVAGSIGNAYPFVPPLNANGAYWLKVTDANNCFNNFNPGLAKVTYKQPIDVAITGNTNICLPNGVALSAINGSNATNITYTWLRNPGAATFSGAIIQDNSIIIAGTYTYTCTATQVGNNCPGTASIIVSANAMPATPTLTSNLLSCQPFSIELSANPALLPGQIYNWSNGAVGQIITGLTDDWYRCWFTDEFGCKSFNDIFVEPSPDQYLWRFPYGCDKMCRQMLPARVDGPADVIFSRWVWNHNGSVVVNNGAFAGQGGNSVCDPLIIDNNPPASGSGIYNWELETMYPAGGVCRVKSNDWDFAIKGCCDVPIVLNAGATVTSLTGPQGIYDQLNFGVTVTPAMANCISINWIAQVIDANLQYVGAYVPGANQNYTSMIANNVATTINALGIDLSPSAVPPYTIQFYFKCLDCVDGLVECVGKVDIPDEPRNALVVKQNDWNMLPNPAIDNVQINFHFANQTISEFLLIDMQGKILQKLQTKEANGSFNWPTAALANGVYQIINRQYGTQVSMQKLVVVH